MGRTHPKLNHSRNLDLFAREVGEASVEFEQGRPTSRQRKYFGYLYAVCRENGVDPKMEHLSGRMDYAVGINTLLSRLRAAGADVPAIARKWDNDWEPQSRTWHEDAAEPSEAAKIGGTVRLDFHGVKIPRQEG